MRVLSIIFFIGLMNFLQAQNVSKVVPFIPDILNEFPNVRDLSMNTTGDELYFTVQSPLGEVSVIVQSRVVEGQWSQPIIVSFSGRHKDLEPFISPDGLRLFFASNRPIHQDSSAVKDFDIWYVYREKPGKTWSEPINLGAPINTKHNEFYPTISRYNNIFFTSDSPQAYGKDNILMSLLDSGKYKEVIVLDSSINSNGYDYNAYISPDESYLIFGSYNRKDGMGSGDLYISYKDENHTWTKAKNMGPVINSRQMDYCPFMDEKTNTLYFTSKRSSIRGVRFQSMVDLKKALHQSENGQSRIYQMGFKPTKR